MKIGILYFSGTGNTASMVEVIKKTLEDKGNAVKVRNIEEGWFDKSEEFDFLIFGTPKYYEYIPFFFLNWIEENVPTTKKKIEAAVFQTGGADMASGYSKIIEILKNKNIEVKLTKTIKMASNYIFASKKELDEKVALEKCKNGEVVGKRFAINICNRNFKLEKANIVMEKLCKSTGNFCWKLGLKNAKKYSVSNECVKCMSCVRNCPTKNIKFNNGQFEFGNECLVCLRCLNICGKNAILYKGKNPKQYKIKLNQLNKKK